MNTRFYSWDFTFEIIVFKLDDIDNTYPCFDSSYLPREKYSGSDALREGCFIDHWKWHSW